jgi:hypothetical protein
MVFGSAEPAYDSAAGLPVCYGTLQYRVFLPSKENQRLRDEGFAITTT